METCDFLAVSGGVWGLAIAHAPVQSQPDAQVLALEKDGQLAPDQTAHKPGVIHSGLHYKPGSLMAHYCREGREPLLRFAEDRGLSCEITEKTVVATNRAQQEQLAQFHRREEENGLDGLRPLGPEEIAEIKPHCRGAQSLWAPQTGIIGFVTVARALKEAGRTQVRIDRQATSIKAAGRVASGGRPANFPGLQTDPLRWSPLRALAPVDRKATTGPHPTISGGGYHELSEDAQRKGKNLIYPALNPHSPFLGMHYIRVANGGVECEPNAVFSPKREGYRTADFGLIKIRWKA